MSRYYNTAETFWRNVEKTDNCWNWTGPKSKRGAGLTSLDGFRENAHRIAYRLAVDPLLEDDLIVRRTCRNLLCVNPDHMRAQLDEEGKRHLVEVYLAGGVSQRQLAERYRMERTTVTRLVKAYRQERGAS